MCVCVVVLKVIIINITLTKMMMIIKTILFIAIVYKCMCIYIYIIIHVCIYIYIYFLKTAELHPARRHPPGLWLVIRLLTLRVQANGLACGVLTTGDATKLISYCSYNHGDYKGVAQVYAWYASTSPDGCSQAMAIVLVAAPARTAATSAATNYGRYRTRQWFDVKSSFAPYVPCDRHLHHHDTSS